MLKRVSWLLAVFMLCSCATTIPTNYTGNDAGYAVIGIGAASGTQYSSYSFLFRRAGAKEAAEKDSGRLVFFQNNLFYSRPPDYKTADEAGVVEVASLPPGRYEIFNFDVFLNMGTVQNHYRSRKEFSIPFEVRPNETVYLGNYQANGIKGRNFFGLPVAGGAFFVVEDRSQVDLGLAKARVPAVRVENVRNTTPDPKQLDAALLIPLDRAKAARQAAAGQAGQ